jgi:hypothetical protein
VVFTEQLNGTDAWRAAACQVLVRRVPDTVIDGALRESFGRFLRGFDAMPRAVLDVQNVRRGEDPRTGERTAYVELASVLAAQIVTHAAEKAPTRAIAPLKILRDEEGTTHKVFIPTTAQKWVFEPAEPTEAEAEALHQIWNDIGSWDPRQCAYARALCEVGDLSALVREKVASYTGEDSNLEILSVDRHAFVRFPSIAAADEFFDRPRGAEWGAELFICRHQAYLPAPALFLGVKPPQSYSFFDFSRAQMSNSTSLREARATRVRETPEFERAKPPPPKTSSPMKQLGSTGEADSADVWVHDLYEAAYIRSPDEKDVPKQEDLQSAGVQSEMQAREALSKEGEEKRGGGAQSEGRQSEAKSTERQDSRSGDGPRSATNGRSKAPRKEKLVVGVKKPVDRWANPFSQLVGFEEEIVPPSSISKETVKVTSAAKRGVAEAASEEGVNGGRVGEEEITGGEGVGNGRGGGSADREGRDEGRPEEVNSERVRGYGKVRGTQETTLLNEELPGEKGESGGLEPDVTQAEGTAVAEKQESGNTDLCNEPQTGEEEIKQGMQQAEASEGQVSGASEMHNKTSYEEETGAVNPSEVDGLPGEELFEDVPEGFEAEPERTGTPEWSRTVSDEMDGINSSIGLVLVSEFSRKPEPETFQTQARGEVKTGDRTVKMSGTLTSGLIPLTESGIRSEFGETESDAPLEFKLSMEHVRDIPLRSLRIEQHSEVRLQKATEEGWELLPQTSDGKVLGGESKVNRLSEGVPEAVAESSSNARADASGKDGGHVTEEETGGTG